MERHISFEAVRKRREIAQKAGIASGAARRAQKSLKQAAKVYFAQSPELTIQIIGALAQKALEGDVKAVDKLEDLLGETVAREELALKKKQLAQAAKADVEKTEESKLCDILKQMAEP